MANTTNLVFAAHNALSILTVSLTRTKALFLYICPPLHSPCLSHPHPPPSHNEEFQDFQSQQAVKFVSGTCSNALGSWWRETDNNSPDLSFLPPVTWSTTWRKGGLWGFWNQHQRGVVEMCQEQSPQPHHLCFLDTLISRVQMQVLET